MLHLPVLDFCGEEIPAGAAGDGGGWDDWLCGHVINRLFFDQEITAGRSDSGEIHPYRQVSDQHAAGDLRNGYGVNQIVVAGNFADLVRNVRDSKTLTMEMTCATLNLVLIEKGLSLAV